MKFTIDHKSPVPLYIQVENLLREMIKEPEYQAGKILPNEVDLSRILAVSRTTTRMALNKLVYDELLVRKKKSGTRVAPPKVNLSSMNWLSFSQEMKAKGMTVKNYELHTSWVYPDIATASFFEIGTDKKILKVERLRGTTDEAFVFFTSYFHPEIGLTGDEDYKIPLYEMLERVYFTVAKLSKEEIIVKAADEFISGKLEIKPGSPVLFRKRFVFDQEDRPMEYNLGYYKAESFVYRTESRRDG